MWYKVLQPDPLVPLPQMLEFEPATITFWSKDPGHWALIPPAPSDGDKYELIGGV